MAHVVSLFRYPIKGFEGESLDRVSLVCGQGIPGDRVVGITRSGAPEGAAPFQQLTTNPGLVHFVPGRREGSATLHERKAVSGGDLLTNPERLAERFGAHTQVIQREDGLGHWDFDDSALSIINVRTVQALSTVLGMPLDPMRFRANLYIEAEPFSEFDWLGRGVDIGQARLSIVRPTKRCSATSVNPQTGALDVNLPAQLNRHFGHLYCGVYARVERAGSVQPGDRITATSQHYPAPLAMAVKVPKAPPLVSWPRPVEVVDVVEEAQGIRSVWLRDPLAVLGSLKTFVAGQHVALHRLTPEGAWRRYTVSGVAHDRLRLTVKQGQGVGSRAVHALKAGQWLQLTGPFGPDHFDLASPAMLFLTAGIGITPMITKLRALADAQYPHPVEVVHSVRRCEELALWSDVTAQVKRLARGSATLHVTQGAENVRGAKAGRPAIDALLLNAATCGAAIHACGPDGFQAQVVHSAARANVVDRLHMDSFATPDSPVDRREIPESGPFNVRFRRSGVSALWHPAEGTLLSFAEAQGLVIPAHCRAGVCLTCACTLVEGDVLALTDASRARAGQVLLCTAVPASDISLDC